MRQYLILHIVARIIRSFQVVSASIPISTAPCRWFQVVSACFSSIFSVCSNSSLSIFLKVCSFQPVFMSDSLVLFFGGDCSIVNEVTCLAVSFKGHSFLSLQLHSFVGFSVLRYTG